MSITTVVEYDNPLDHVYDSDRVEFNNGQVKLKSLVDPDENFYFNFDKDGVLISKRGLKSLSLPDHNVANPNTGEVVGGWLELNNNDFSYAYIDADSIASTDRFTFQMKVKVNFASVSTNINICRLESTDNGSAIEFYMQNQGGGVTRIWRREYNSAGVQTASTLLTTFSFSVGDEFEIAYTRGGSQNLTFVDGQLLSTLSNPAGFNLANCRLAIGGPYSNRTNFSVKDVVLWNTNKIIADYTSPSPELIEFDTDGEAVCTILSFSMDSWQSFAATFEEEATKSRVRVNMIKNSKVLWYNGTNWVDADGTAATVNTVQEVIDNLGTFPLAIGVGANVQVCFFLQSITGYDTPTLDSFSISYGFGYEGELVNRCAVYGQVFASNGLPVEGAVISVDSPDHLNGNVIIAPKSDTTTDVKGNFAISLVETETTETYVDFTIEYQEGSITKRYEVKKKIIPNVASVKFSDLVDFEE